MITAFKQPRVKIFQRFSLFLLPGLLTISTTLISCKVIPKPISIKEAMLTSEQYAAITPETISQK